MSVKPSVSPRVLHRSGNCEISQDYCGKAVGTRLITMVTVGIGTVHEVILLEQDGINFLHLRISTIE